MIGVIKGVVQGIFIGLANIIPGVSGGTVALVLGIYERFIRALHSVDVRFFMKSLAVLSFRKKAWREWGEELKRIDAGFLACIGVGAIGAIVATAGRMEVLLTHHHAASYGFFSGLVLFSMVFPYKYLKRKSWKEAVSFLLAVVAVVALSLSVSDEAKIEKEVGKQEIEQAKAGPEAASTSDEDVSLVSMEHPGGKRLAFLLLSAGVAVSAMVLPGVSGSFVLLLIGAYFDVLHAVKYRQVVVLAVFAAGCLVGLLAFSRIMDYLLKKAHDLTMAFMVGLMAGSMWVLWPFKRTAVVGDKTLYLSNELPAAFDRAGGLTLAAFVAGAAIVIAGYIVEKRLGEKKA